MEKLLKAVRDAIARIRNEREKRYWNECADFGDTVIYDKDVAAFAKSHMRFIDRFDFRKVTEAALYSFAVLANGDEKEYENQKFEWNRGD